MATTLITHKDDGSTVVTVILEESEAWHGAHVSVSVRKPTHDEPDDLAHVDMYAEVYTDEDGNEEADGTLYLNAWECANPDGGQVENHYPDYFSKEMVEANA